MGAGDLSGDHGKGGVALTAPLDAVGMNEDHVGDPAPLSHQPRAGFSEIGGAGFATPQRSGSGLVCSSLRATALERPP